MRRQGVFPKHLFLPPGLMLNLVCVVASSVKTVCTSVSCLSSIPMISPFVTAPSPEAAVPMLHWREGGEARSARWRSERGAAPPKRVVLADDSMSADTAYRLACEGTGLLWRGDFQNARMLVQALARRADKPARPKRSGRRKAGGQVEAAPVAPPVFPEAFHLHRQAQAQ